MSLARLLLSLRPHLFASIALFLVLAVMAVSDDFKTRGMLIAPAIVLFFAALALYGLEYDALAKKA